MSPPTSSENRSDAEEQTVFACYRLIRGAIVHEANLIAKGWAGFRQGKSVFGHSAIVFSPGAIATLGHLVWAHYVFVSGMSIVLGSVFSTSSFVIAVPSAIKIFKWLGTVWKGSLRFTVPMCFALAFVTIFVMGGPTGLRQEFAP